MDGILFLALLAAVIIPLGIWGLDDRPPPKGKK
jgi:hypothetical protein